MSIDFEFFRKNAPKGSCTDSLYKNIFRYEGAKFFVGQMLRFKSIKDISYSFDENQSESGTHYLVAYYNEVKITFSCDWETGDNIQIKREEGDKINVETPELESLIEVESFEDLMLGKHIFPPLDELLGY